MDNEYKDFDCLLGEDIKNGCGGCRHVNNNSGAFCRQYNAKNGSCPCISCIVKMMWPCDCLDWRKWFNLKFYKKEN